MTGTTRSASIAAALLAALARTAAAQLSTAEVFQRIDAAVSSAAPNAGDSASYKYPPTTVPVVGSGGDTIQTVRQVATGGTAQVSLFVSWNMSASSITANATFTANTTASGLDSASAGFDHSFKIPTR